MEELIAKKYIKAIKKGSDIKTMQNIALIFSAISKIGRAHV